jgi:hypothetical protein
LQPATKPHFRCDGRWKYCRVHLHLSLSLWLLFGVLCSSLSCPGAFVLRPKFQPSCRDLSRASAFLMSTSYYAYSPSSREVSFPSPFLPAASLLSCVYGRGRLPARCRLITSGNSIVNVTTVLSCTVNKY